MLLPLFEYLSEFFGPFRVVEFLSTRAILATLTSLLFSLFLGPKFINKIKYSNGKPIVGLRVKRSEGLIFKICYQIHKLISNKQTQIYWCIDCWCTPFENIKWSWPSLSHPIKILSDHSKQRWWLCMFKRSTTDTTSTRHSEQLEAWYR